MVSLVRPASGLCRLWMTLCFTGRLSGWKFMWLWFGWWWWGEWNWSQVFFGGFRQGWLPGVGWFSTAKNWKLCVTLPACQWRSWAKPRTINGIYDGRLNLIGRLGQTRSRLRRRLGWKKEMSRDLKHSTRIMSVTQRDELEVISSSMPFASRYLIYAL